MPPRHAYWTIIFGNQPTSFRTATQEELLPTFRQIQSKHPDAVMMWFAHGRLWKSPEEARESRLRHRSTRPPRQERPRERRPDPRGPRPEWKQRPDAPRPERPGPRPDGKERWRNPDHPHSRPPTADRRPATGDRRPPTADRGPHTENRERPRGRDWRPGGAHKDPRDRFKVPRDVKRARFKAKLRRDRQDPPPGAPKPRGHGGKRPGGGDRKKKDEE